MVSLTPKTAVEQTPGPFQFIVQYHTETDYPWSPEPRATLEEALNVAIEQCPADADTIEVYVNDGEDDGPLMTLPIPAQNGLDDVLAIADFDALRKTLEGIEWDLQRRTLVRIYKRDDTEDVLFMSVAPLPAYQPAQPSDDLIDNIVYVLLASLAGKAISRNAEQIARVRDFALELIAPTEK